MDSQKLKHGEVKKESKSGQKFDVSHFNYDCSQCGEESTIRPKEVVRCTRCGSRVLFKKRTKRLVQFEAR
ncbi:DNA-directed RNA polymerases I, II, and III subunit RPABC4-like protein [Neoconidiobolus thromboides FSU 785]|nr:DNA-directed RNA polymerases I, II, and III subunit RPABC4-like protein [Neoconidiobolus thromboides FSU 785]